MPSSGMRRRVASPKLCPLSRKEGAGIEFRSGAHGAEQLDYVKRRFPSAKKGSATDQARRGGGGAQRDQGKGQEWKGRGGSPYFIGFAIRPPDPLTLALLTQGQTQASLLEATFREQGLKLWVFMLVFLLTHSKGVPTALDRQCQWGNGEV